MPGPRILGKTPEKHYGKKAVLIYDYLREAIGQEKAPEKGATTTDTPYKKRGAKLSTGLNNQ